MIQAANAPGSVQTTHAQAPADTGTRPRPRRLLSGLPKAIGQNIAGLPCRRSLTLGRDRRTPSHAAVRTLLKPLRPLQFVAPRKSNMVLARQGTGHRGDRQPRTVHPPLSHRRSIAPTADQSRPRRSRRLPPAHPLKVSAALARSCSWEDQNVPPGQAAHLSGYEASSRLCLRRYSLGFRQGVSERHPTTKDSGLACRGKRQQASSARLRTDHAVHLSGPYHDASRPTSQQIGGGSRFNKPAPRSDTSGSRRGTGEPADFRAESAAGCGAARPRRIAVRGNSPARFALIGGTPARSINQAGQLLEQAGGQNQDRLTAPGWRHR